MRRILASTLFMLAAVLTHAQDATMASAKGLSDIREQIVKELNCGLYPQLVNVQSRSSICLDGSWKAIVDQYENGYYNYRLHPMPDSQTFFADKSWKADKTRLIEYDFDTDGALQVPGDWNTQDDKLYYYEGTVWYRQKFNLTKDEDKRYFLYFGAANYETIVGVNGTVIGKHTGGYTPFNFEITSIVKDGENTVIAKVDNKRRLEGVPTVNSDWWNYGGLTRSVYVIETPSVFVRDYSLSLQDRKKGIIGGYVQLDGSAGGEKVNICIPELEVSVDAVVNEAGYAEFKFKANPVLWSPSMPKLYDVEVSSGSDVLKDRIGFRTIEADGNRLLLNGEEIFCKGICIHEEMPYGMNGRAFSREHALTLLSWAKEMNCNFVRLAHYPHNEEMIRLAEEIGIMVWSEIPVYWTIHWWNDQTYANAELQLTDMITRDKNRANVIIWSVANETPRSEERLTFLSRLISKARELDGTRLISAAMEKEYIDPTHCTVNDELAEIADLISFNQYVGWYDGSSDKCDSIQWTFDINKPVFISEFGGGALAGMHGDVSERFTEEYQEELFKKNTAMFDRIPGLCGTTPWILKDFRSPRRQLKGIQDDYNRKGLISDQGMKKKAFYVMQEWYSNK